MKHVCPHCRTPEVVAASTTLSVGDGFRTAACFVCNECKGCFFTKDQVEALIFELMH